MYLSQLPYTQNSAGIFNHFAEQPYSVFLDSCGLDRFDIIAANPREVIIAHDPREDAFTNAKQRLTAQPAPIPMNIPADLPFTFGAIGYFSYDLGHALAALPPKTHGDIALPAAVVGLYDWSIVVDHGQHAAWLISREHPSHPELKAIAAKASQPTTIAGQFSITQKFQANMSPNEYAAAFAQVQQHIRGGDCYQVNLAQRFTATYQGSPWIAYQSLRAKNQMPMAAYMRLPQGAVLCLSPERFIQSRDNQVVTQPIKGTSPRHSDPRQDQQSAQALLNSRKDRAENLMIVDLLRNDLGKCCRPGSIKVPALCELASFINVHHLVSTITGTLEDGQHPLDLLRHCFPGGSITGAPKRRAMEIIAQLEPVQRSLYCGCIAYADVRGQMDSNIAIRTLLCSDNQIHCYGGGGIVSDSIEANEYQEIKFKISRLLNILESI